MKKITILIVLLFSIAFTQQTSAQVSLNINIGSQPTWGPVGYEHVDYYYMPDIEAYYYVPRRQFIYYEGNRWIFANSLPPRYGGYDLYNGYKVIINEPRPYLRHNVYRVQYVKYKGGKGPKQEIIRDTHDQRYKNNGPGNSDHHDNGNGKNKGNGNGDGNEGKGHGNEGHGKGHGKGKG